MPMYQLSIATIFFSIEYNLLLSLWTLKGDEADPS